MESADAPIATPPASVARITSSISSRCKVIRETPQAVMQLAEIDIKVLIAALCCAAPVAIAALKEGQYTQRKIVPTMEIS